MMAGYENDAEQAPTFKVLVADDHPINREFVRRILEPLGASVTETADGAEAVEAAATIAFDLILLDLKMPGMDGATAVKRIRASDSPNCRAPILAFSAGQEAYDELLLPNEFDGALAKPLAPDTLIEAFASYCGQDAGAEAQRRFG
jgi:two-component system, sensor histidine kinase